MRTSKNVTIIADYTFIFSWKDLNCPFRKDPNTHLIFLPTLLRWKSPQRLDGEKCSDKDLVEMLFEDEE